MNEGMPYADIIILALIAGFVLLRLRSVLGQKTGYEKPPIRDYPDTSREGEIVQLPERLSSRMEEDRARDDELVGKIAQDEVKSGIAAIKAADANFTLKGFMDGAKGAFEMLFDAFNKGDKQVLQMLLSPALYTVFSQECDKRQKEDLKRETTLVAIESEELAAAKLERNTARITVRFISEQVTVVRNREGAIVEGNPSQTDRVEDEWVFERDVNARNPNWKIIET